MRVDAQSLPQGELAPSLRGRPNGTDVMVTFATGSVATMACNWVATVRRAGVKEVLIGALDQAMMDACALNGVPCILIEGGEITKALASRSAGNVRSDPRLYPKMSVLKVGFYNELLFWMVIPRWESHLTRYINNIFSSGRYSNWTIDWSGCRSASR